VSYLPELDRFLGLRSGAWAQLQVPLARSPAGGGFTGGVAESLAPGVALALAPQALGLRRPTPCHRPCGGPCGRVAPPGAFFLDGGRGVGGSGQGRRSGVRRVWVGAGWAPSGCELPSNLGDTLILPGFFSCPGMYAGARERSRACPVIPDVANHLPLSPSYPRPRR